VSSLFREEVLDRILYQFIFRYFLVLAILSTLELGPAPYPLLLRCPISWHFCWTLSCVLSRNSFPRPVRYAWKARPFALASQAKKVYPQSLIPRKTPSSQPLPEILLKYLALQLDSQSVQAAVGRTKNKDQTPGTRIQERGSKIKDPGTKCPGKRAGTRINTLRKRPKTRIQERGSKRLGNA